MKYRCAASVLDLLRELEAFDIPQATNPILHVIKNACDFIAKTQHDSLLLNSTNPALCNLPY